MRSFDYIYVLGILTKLLFPFNKPKSDQTSFIASDGHSSQLGLISDTYIPVPHAITMTQNSQKFTSKTEKRGAYKTLIYEDNFKFFKN